MHNLRGTCLKGTCLARTARAAAPLVLFAVNGLAAARLHAPARED